MSDDTSRDVEKSYSQSGMVAKLRRLADALESGKPFQIQIAGERVRVPVDAVMSIEHERGDGEEEIEFQLKWSYGEAGESQSGGEMDADEEAAEA